MKQKSAPTNKDRQRLTCLLLFLLGLFAIILPQFYNLQIVENKKWSQEARKQHFISIKEPFHRGVFFSNGSLKKNRPEKDKPLVVDILKFHLHADLITIPESIKPEIAKKICEFLDIKNKEQEIFTKQFASRSRNRKIAQWVDKETQSQILSWWLPFARKNRIPRNALFFSPDYKRCYPFGKLMGQLLHTIRDQKDEISGASTPTGGLELYFNKFLQGRNGKRLLMRSPRNSFETGEIISSPVDGADIYLTIDITLQAIAEEEIKKGVEKSGAKQGWAVMMDPYTGQILALAQYPFFDPSDYKSYFNDKILIEQTQLKAMTDAIEPGSVIKPFTLCAALLANKELIAEGKPPLFDPEEKIPTDNGRFPGRSKPLTDVSPRKFFNMNMAMQKSSNIYMARLVERIVHRLGNKWYRSILYDVFGFGQKTKIEYPTETAGIIPTIGKKHPNGTLEWSLATPPSLAMGYNLQINSLQLMRAYALLANGGYYVKPTLLKKIAKKNKNGQIEILIDNSLKKANLPQVIDKKIIDQVVCAMKYTTKPGGTAPKADVFGYTEAGKTSTVHKIVNGQYANTHRSLFIGFTPVKNPAFVLLTVIDEPKVGFIKGQRASHRGGKSSAPIFKAIAQRALQYLGITPDDPFGYRPDDPRYDAEKADWIPEAKKLLELSKEWNGI